MSVMPSLTAVDYVVIVVMFLIPLGIGVFFAYWDRRKTTREEYLMGGRQMSLFPITMSMFVTFQSAISLMGFPTEVYNFGSMYSLMYLGCSLSYLVGYVLLIPVMFPLKLTSLYEYLQLRFQSPSVRMLSTVIGMCQTLFYMAVALFSPALALQTAVSIPLWMSVVIVGVIGTVYTAVGGIKSVVWTDTFQTLIVFIGIFMVLIKGSLTVGGMTESFSVAKAGGRISYDVISPDPRTRHSWWSMMIGGMCMWMANVFNQSTLQRMASMRTEREANISFFLNAPLMILYGGSLFLVGVVMYAYFSHMKCDPIQGGLLADYNQILPYFVLHVLQDIPGLSGFYMATLFSGGLSTISSGMNALAANTVEDLLKKYLQDAKESNVTLLTKALVLLYGLIIVGLAYGASSLTGPVTQMSASVFGACGGPILGMFLMGILIPWANKYGALIGGTVAIIFNVFLALTGQLYGRKHRRLPPVSIENCPLNVSMSSGFPNSAYVDATLNSSANSFFASSVSPLLNFNLTTYYPSTYLETTSKTSPYDFGFFLFDISYEWYSVTGLAMCLIVGLLVSYVTKGLIDSSPQPELLASFSRRWCANPGLQEKAEKKSRKNPGQVEIKTKLELKDATVRVSKIGSQNQEKNRQNIPV